MDRREFVLKTVLGTAGLSAAACGGGGGGGASVAAPAAPVTSAPPVVPTVTPPVSPSTPATPAVVGAAGRVQQFLTWDAGSGPSRDYWSIKLQLPWANPGAGDWLDAHQLSQGSTAYASATAALGPVTLLVTDLVNRWLSNGLNRGFYIRTDQAWPITFAGRTDATPLHRPTLTVDTDQTSTVLPCI